MPSGHPTRRCRAFSVVCFIGVCVLGEGGGLTFRSTSISDWKSPSAMAVEPLRILAATVVPFQYALCTMPNSPSPAVGQIDRQTVRLVHNAKLALTCSRTDRQAHVGQPKHVGHWASRKPHGRTSWTDRQTDAPGMSQGPLNPKPHPQKNEHPVELEVPPNQSVPGPDLAAG
jgi:hypothetical protein